MEENIKIPDLNIVKSTYQEQLYKKNLFHSILSTLAVIISTVAIVAIFTLLIFPIEKIDGDNLDPKLNNNDIVLCMKQINYNRGDLICFSYGDLTLVKRIVGVPGDYISFDNNNELYVNNKKVNEDYLIEAKSGDYENIYPYQVPDESFFVLSDNREIMTDSRSAYIGTIKQNLIVGKLLFRFWPLNKFEFIK